MTENQEIRAKALELAIATYQTFPENMRDIAQIRESIIEDLADRYLKYITAEKH